MTIGPHRNRHERPSSADRPGCGGADLLRGAIMPRSCGVAQGSLKITHRTEHDKRSTSHNRLRPVTIHATRVRRRTYHNLICLRAGVHVHKSYSMNNRQFDDVPSVYLILPHFTYLTVFHGRIRFAERGLFLAHGGNGSTSVRASRFCPESLPPHVRSEAMPWRPSGNFASGGTYSSSPPWEPRSSGI